MGIESITVNRPRMVEVIKTSLDAREKNIGIFSEIKTAPEENYIELIKKHAVKTGDNQFALNALFFTTSMVHGDNTELLFKRIADANLIEKYDWIFKPQEVLSRGQGETVNACFEFFRPGGYNSAAFDQWTHNCSVLLNKYQGDLENFFKANNNDASKIIDSLVVKPRAKTYEKIEFRRFGPKLSRLFMQWVNQYDFYQLDNVSKNGIPVDFQVCRVMIQTNAIDLKNPCSTHDVSVRTVLPALTEIFDAENLDPRLVSEAIWYIGSRCCNKGRHDLCPISDMCTSLISRKPYDDNGKFDPTDTGRFNI